MSICNFSDFCNTLLESGFSMGGGNSKGIYAVIPFSWDSQQPVNSVIQWHTGNPETDPWEWRMRVLEERTDIAYSKLFFRTSGYITANWYPYFLAIRRKNKSFEETYFDGKISNIAKKIYEIICDNGETPLHIIKNIGGFTKEDNSQFERGLTELQTHMFITMCGRAQKTNKNNEGYGWSSTVFTTVEDFWQKRNLTLSQYSSDDAYDKIKSQILKLNPLAEEKVIKKFING